MKCEEFYASVRSSRVCAVDNAKLRFMHSLRQIEETGKELDARSARPISRETEKSNEKRLFTVKVMFRL
jgi:hypothetical protein